MHLIHDSQSFKKLNRFSLFSELLWPLGHTTVLISITQCLCPLVGMTSFNLLLSEGGEGGKNLTLLFICSPLFTEIGN